MTLIIKYKIHEYRIKKNMTLTELAEKSGVSRANINKIENNLNHPSVYTLCLIADALNVQPYQLYRRYYQKSQI